MCNSLYIIMQGNVRSIHRHCASTLIICISSWKRSFSNQYRFLFSISLGCFLCRLPDWMEFFLLLLICTIFLHALSTRNVSLFVLSNWLQIDYFLQYLFNSEMLFHSCCIFTDLHCVPYVAKEGDNLTHIYILSSSNAPGWANCLALKITIQIPALILCINNYRNWKFNTMGRVWQNWTEWKMSEQ